MAVSINERVSVLAMHRAVGSMMPMRVKWRGRVYPITQIGYHHTLHEGRTLLHIFSVISNTIAMRLRLDTETLGWMLEEIAEN